MLLPTQHAAFTVITSVMGSVIDDIEKRRLEDEEKLRGKKEEDKVLKTRIKPDGVAEAANAKINAHFFGALKREEDPMVVLAARFAAVMGLTRGDGESNVDFGQRLDDALTFTDLVSKTDALSKPTVVGMDTFRVSVGKLNAAIDGSDKQPGANTSLLARFVKQNDLQQAEGEDDLTYKNRMSVALTKARSELPATVADVETKSGLRDLGITAREMIEAIKQPYGDAAKKIQSLLDDKARDEKTSTAETSKIIQRLEEVADPKTIEELKEDRLEKDPTKVEDAQTRKEREEDIRSLEAGEKLEDVQAIQDAVKDRNDTALEDGTPPGTDREADAVSTEALETIQVMAAGAEAAKIQADAETAATQAPAAQSPGEDEGSGDAQGPSDDEQAVMLARAGQTADPTNQADAQAGVLTIHIDENGIYDMLARKKAA